MMKFTIKNKKLALDIMLFFVIVAILFYVRGSLFDVITPFVYAMILSYLLNPAVNFLEKKKMKRPFAILLIFVLIFLILTLVFMSFVPSLANDISVFIKNVPDIFDFVEEFVSKFREGKITILPEAMMNYIDIDQEFAKIGEALKNNLGQLSNVLIQSTGTLLDIVMTPIITFYLLKDKKKLLDGVSSVFTTKQRGVLGQIFADIDVVLGGFIKGQMIVAAFVGTLIGIGCAVIGVPYALTIGLVAGLTNIIPYFGPWLGGILPVVLALMNSPITVISVIVWIIIVQQIESSFISPQIMASSVGLHPLTVMFSVLFFGKLLGVPGMILGVPITGTLKVLVKHYKNFRSKMGSPDAPIPVLAGRADKPKK